MKKIYLYIFRVNYFIEMTVKVSFSRHLHISQVSDKRYARGRFCLISVFSLAALEPARLLLQDTRLYTHLIKLNRVGVSRGGVFARARLVVSAPGERLSPSLLPGAQGPGQRRGRGVSLPAPPPAPRPRRDAAGPAAGAQDAVGPHKRFVFTTSFRSLSGLPATIKGQVCSQEKTRVGRGLHTEKGTLQRLFRQRVQLGSAPGHRARHPAPPEPASGSARRGAGLGGRRGFGEHRFVFRQRLTPRPLPAAAGPPRASAGRRSPSEPVRAAAGGRAEERRGEERRDPRRLPHSRVPPPQPPRAPPAFGRDRRGGSCPREPPHAPPPPPPRCPGAGAARSPRHPPPAALPGLPRLGGQVLVCLSAGSYSWAWALGSLYYFFFFSLCCCAEDFGFSQKNTSQALIS